MNRTTFFRAGVGGQLSTNAVKALALKTQVSPALVSIAAPSVMLIRIMALGSGGAIPAMGRFMPFMLRTRRLTGISTPLDSPAPLEARMDAERRLRRESRSSRQLAIG